MSPLTLHADKEKIDWHVLELYTALKLQRQDGSEAESQISGAAEMESAALLLIMVSLLLDGGLGKGKSRSSPKEIREVVP